MSAEPEAGREDLRLRGKKQRKLDVRILEKRARDEYLRQPQTELKLIFGRLKRCGSMNGAKLIPLVKIARAHLG